jgi:hypothetical protein
MLENTSIPESDVEIVLETARIFADSAYQLFLNTARTNTETVDGVDTKKLMDIITSGRYSNGFLKSVGIRTPKGHLYGGTTLIANVRAAVDSVKGVNHKPTRRQLDELIVELQTDENLENFFLKKKETHIPRVGEQCPQEVVDYVDAIQEAFPKEGMAGYVILQETLSDLLQHVSNEEVNVFVGDVQAQEYPYIRTVIGILPKGIEYTGDTEFDVKTQVEIDGHTQLAKFAKRFYPTWKDASKAVQGVGEWKRELRTDLESLIRDLDTSDPTEFVNFIITNKNNPKYLTEQNNFKALRAFVDYIYYKLKINDRALDMRKGLYSIADGKNVGYASYTAGYGTYNPELQLSSKLGRKGAAVWIETVQCKEDDVTSLIDRLEFYSKIIQLVKTEPTKYRESEKPWMDIFHKADEFAFRRAKIIQSIVSGESSEIPEAMDIDKNATTDEIDQEAIDIALRRTNYGDINSGRIAMRLAFIWALNNTDDDYRQTLTGLLESQRKDYLTWLRDTADEYWYTRADKPNRARPKLEDIILHIDSKFL